MIKKLLAAAVLASAAFGAYAQHDTMYLIKGDRVVGKYNVDDVDYATFSLPEGVNDATVWLDIVEVSKNSVTYIVNTVNPTTAYAHNAISYYTAEYAALDFMGTPFKDLSDSEKVEILQYCLSYDAYVGMTPRLSHRRTMPTTLTASTSALSPAHSISSVHGKSTPRTTLRSKHSPTKNSPPRLLKPAPQPLKHRL